jgi:hypothetical protein
MITQELLAEQILEYLNHRMELVELVHWAEDAVVTFTEADERPPNADVVWDSLLYVGAADNAQFSLTWEVIKDSLYKLGRPIQGMAA